MEDIPPTEVKSEFAYQFDFDDDSLTIVKDGSHIVLSYWDCILLNRILDRNLKS